MMFRSQAQAKQFFIDKILFQAQKDRIPLSKAEQYMLGWTETEGGFEIDQKLNDEFEKQTTREKYETKISVLIKHAYDSDVLNDPAKEKTYRAAYRTLDQGDHYLLIIIKQAIKAISSNHKSDLWLKDKILLVMAGLAIALPFFAALYFGLSLEWYDFMAACVFFYLIPFCMYSIMLYTTSKKKAHSLAKIIFFQIAIATFAISTYIYLISYFNIIDLKSHANDQIGFRTIISVPLFIVSVILLDFTLKRGIVYDGIADLIDKLRKSEQKQK